MSKIDNNDNCNKKSRYPSYSNWNMHEENEIDDDIVEGLDNNITETDNAIQPLIDGEVYMGLNDTMELRRTDEEEMI